MAYHVLLLDDVDDGLAKSIANCLLLDGRFQVHCLTQSESSELSRSKRTGTTVADLSTSEAMVDAVERHAAVSPIDVILPIQETMIQLAWPVAEPLNRLGLLGPQPSAELCALADHKWTCREIFRDADISMPRAWPSVEISTKSQEIAGFSERLLLKPARGFGGDGLQLFSSGSDFLESLGAETIDWRGDQQDWVLEEYIEGKNASASLLAFKGELIGVATKRTVVEQDRAFKSAGLLSEYYHDESIEAIAESFVRTTDWSGPAHIDLRIDNDGQIYALEVNPRFWQTVAGPAALGSNFPAMACLLALGHDIPPLDAVTGPYLDLALLIGGWHNLGRLRGRMRQSVAGAKFGSQLRDPAVELPNAARQAKRQLKGLVKRSLEGR